MKIRLADPETLKPYPHNPRLISQAAIDKVLASVREFGWRQPIVVDEDGVILVGHTRRLAALKGGYKAVPVHDAIGLSDAQKKAYRLADNRTGEESQWDLPVLSAEIAALRLEGFDLGPLGFDLPELRSLEAKEPGKDAEATPEPPAKPVTRPGDIWELGDHYLLCGDSTKAEDVDAVLDGAKIDCTFTSPPYGVGIDYGEYEDSIENLRVTLPALASLVFANTAPHGLFVVNFGDIAGGRRVIRNAPEPCEYPMAVEYWPIFSAAGWLLFTRRIWAKPHARVAAPWTAKSARAATDFEHLWTWKKPGAASKVGRSKLSPLGVWDTSKGDGVDIGKGTHGAGMPVELVRRSLDAHSLPGDVIFEPFCGTGTTLVGAEILGRRCYAIEISPAYCDVIVKRWEEFTGKKAKLAENGETFEQTAKRRKVKTK
jgi:DNA modification methylase